MRQRPPLPVGTRRRFNPLCCRSSPPTVPSMELQFTDEVAQLRLDDGEVFHGEGILAITKTLLQSGVTRVSGY